MSFPYQDASRPVKERVADLLSRMSLQEKTGQMTNLRGWEQYRRDGDTITILDSFKETFKRVQVGDLSCFVRADWYTCRNWENGLTPKLVAKAVNLFQKHALENSRWKIPMSFEVSAFHGAMALGATAFPCALAMGSSWNEELLERIQEATGRELRAMKSTCVAIDLDIATDPRWSRVEQTLGEDPFLVSKLGVASTRGARKAGAAGFLAHLGGHGSPEGGHNAGPCHAGPVELRNVHFKPFRECVKAGAKFLHSSYNTIDGIPCTGDRELLTGLLREEWGFEGVVIPDAGAIFKLKDDRFAATDAEACAMAIKAGVDTDLWSPDRFIPAVKKALEQGLLSMEDVDRAAGRVLRLKFESGLFDKPFADEGAPVEILGCKEHRELALEAARQALVLISNPEGLLPLKNVKRLAVVGPNADVMENQLGDYTSPQRREDVSTVLDGVKKLAAKREIEVVYAKGCKVRAESRAGFAEAIAAAKSADATILVLGGSSVPSCEIEHLDNGAARCVEIKKNSEIDKESGEGYDRASLRLLGRQEELLRELKATGKPLIVVLIAGRPLIIDEVLKEADAVLLAWYPGPRGGQAVAEALFGEFNPGGKLPISFPRSEGQLPVHHWSHQARPNYIDMESKPLLRFGFGLSYTTFKISKLAVDKKTIRADESLNVSCEISNEGELEGDEVAELYLTAKTSSVARPLRELRGFKRIRLKPGEKRRVEFKLGPEELGVFNRKLVFEVEPGSFIAAVGDSLDSLQEVEFEVKP